MTNGSPIEPSFLPDTTQVSRGYSVSAEGLSAVEFASPDCSFSQETNAVKDKATKIGSIFSFISLLVFFVKVPALNNAGRGLKRHRPDPLNKFGDGGRRYA